MSTPIYTVAVLVELLNKMRAYIIDHQEIVVMGNRGINTLLDILYEQVQDMLYEDKDEKTSMSYPYTYYLDKHPEGSEKYLLALYNATQQLANSVLIDKDGGCEWVNHRALEPHGYRVRCGERDSFGWLTGVIYCDDFEFCYG